MSEGARESIPADCGLHACSLALAELDCVAATDIVAGTIEPSGHPTIEVTIAPGALDDAGRMPAPVAEVVYDDRAPWDCGLVDVSRRMVDLQTVLVR